jgi:hypothetical protein
MVFEDVICVFFITEERQSLSIFFRGAVLARVKLRSEPVGSLTSDLFEVR